MRPLDRMPENALRRTLLDQQGDLDEFKAAQARGSSSILTARVFTTAAYDVEFVGVSGFKLHRADVEFIPDDLTFGGALGLRLYVKGMDASNTPVRILPRVMRRPRSDGRQIWSVYYETFGSGSSTRRLKFYVFATGSGTLNATVVS